MKLLTVLDLWPPFTTRHGVIPIPSRYTVFTSTYVNADNSAKEVLNITSTYLNADNDPLAVDPTRGTFTN